MNHQSEPVGLKNHCQPGQPRRRSRRYHTYSIVVYIELTGVLVQYNPACVRNIGSSRWGSHTPEPGKKLATARAASKCACRAAVAAPTTCPAWPPETQEYQAVCSLASYRYSLWPRPERMLLLRNAAAPRSILLRSR